MVNGLYTLTHSVFPNFSRHLLPFLLSFHFDFCRNYEIILLDSSSCNSVKNHSRSWQFGLCEEAVVETFRRPRGYGLYFHSALWERIVLRRKVWRWAVERVLRTVAEEVEVYQHCWSTGRGTVGLTSIKSKLCNLQEDRFFRGGDCD